MKTLRHLPIALFFLAAAAWAQEAPSSGLMTHLQAAQERLAVEDFDGALGELDAALKIAAGERELAQVYAMRAIAHQSAGHYEKAAADYDEAIERIQNNAELHWRRAQVRDVLGDLQGAIADYTQLTVLATDHPAGYLGRAQAKAHLGDYKGALEDLEAVMFVQPDAPDGYRLQGRVKLAMGDVEGGKKDLATAIEKADEERKGWTHFSRGLALYDLGETDAALADLEKAIELDPEGNDYARFYVYLARAAKGEADAAAADLKAFLDTRDVKDDWYSRIVGFLTGKTTADELLEAAKADDELTTKQHRCEAHWYIAAKLLIAGDQAKAAEHLDACLATNQYAFIEHESAAWAKKRLSPSQD